MSKLVFYPSSTALLVIDVQKAFEQMEAAGYRRNNPLAVARIAKILEIFRKAEVPIFHIRHANPASRFDPDGPGFEPIAEARELEGEPVIVKTVNSAFIGTDLERRLRTNDIETVVIVGATTNHCVETTVRMAGNLGFETYLVRDATWTFDRTGLDGRIYSAEEVHAMSMANLDDEFCRIVNSKDITEAF